MRMDRMILWKSMVVALPAVLLLAACQTAPSRVPAATSRPGTAAPDLRPMPVSNVSIEVGVGSPIPVDVLVSGEWPDLCAQLAEMKQRVAGQAITIDLLASSPDPACPPDVLGLPFRIAIPINVVELAEGTYTVTVNGVSTTFDVPVKPPAGPVSSDGLVHYQGPGPYGSTPQFDVGYDPAVWEYVADDGSGRPSQLVHRELEGCSLWLRAGAVGATPLDTVQLGGREWAIGQVQPTVLLYATPPMDTVFVLGLTMPDVAVRDGKNPCQEAAEVVIDTLREVPS